MEANTHTTYNAIHLDTMKLYTVNWSL